ARDHRALHLTGRHERVGERGLSHAGVAERGDDARLLASHLEPCVVQTGELALATDQRFRLEAPFLALRYLPGFRGPGRRAPALAQQVRDPYQVGARLRSQLVRQPGLEAAVDLEGVAAIAHPRPRLHDAAHRILGQGVELEQQLRMPLDGLEISDPTPVVHLPDEGIADPWHQLGAPLVLPLLKLHGSRYLESVQELTSDLGLSGVQPARVHLHRTRNERPRSEVSSWTDSR